MKELEPSMYLLCFPAPPLLFGRAIALLSLFYSRTADSRRPLPFCLQDVPQWDHNQPRVSVSYIAIMRRSDSLSIRTMSDLCSR